MQIHIDKVTDVKTGEYGISSKIHQGNQSWYVNEDATPHIGKTVEAEISEKTSKSGNKYRIAKILKVLEGKAAAASNGASGGVTWDEYLQMAEAAHGLAMKLEPDVIEKEQAVDAEGIPYGLTSVRVDRSAARAALINTAMIAFTNGRIVNPLDDDDLPF